jgi:putative hydrolase of the HAD superfamily
MKLQAVTFDAGGTLLYPHPSVGHIYAETAGRHGLTTDAGAMEEAFRRAWAESHHPNVPGGSVSQFNWWRQLVFRTLDFVEGDVADRDLYFRELYELFAQPEVWRLYPDALEIIEAVRGRGLKVALVSNWDHRLRPVLGGLGLLPLLDSICISCEIGVEKPHPKIFQAAMSDLAIETPAVVLHVGDSYREDILGATALGMRAVWVERGGVQAWDGPTIRRLTELVPMLGA